MASVGEIMIGKTVKVIIDRPLGSKHPVHDMIYTVNYGYVEGVFAPDGEEQDVYVLGVDIPLTEFEGEIVAVVHRLNDMEDKWVAAPSEMKFSEEQIRDLLHFQEQYFESEIIM